MLWPKPKTVCHIQHLRVSAQGPTWQNPPYNVLQNSTARSKQRKHNMDSDVAIGCGMMTMLVAVRTAARRLRRRPPQQVRRDATADTVYHQSARPKNLARGPPSQQGAVDGSVPRLGLMLRAFSCRYDAVATQCAPLSGRHVCPPSSNHRASLPVWPCLLQVMMLSATLQVGLQPLRPHRTHVRLAHPHNSDTIAAQGTGAADDGLLRELDERWCGSLRNLARSGRRGRRNGVRKTCANQLQPIYICWPVLVMSCEPHQQLSIAGVATFFAVHTAIMYTIRCYIASR